jgi:hypothetical protein
MAHFYAEVTGGRGTATCSGTQSSGLQGHLRGWNKGVRVTLSNEDGEDVVRVWRTSGSNGSGSDELITEF